MWYVPFLNLNQRVLWKELYVPVMSMWSLSMSCVSHDH